MAIICNSTRMFGESAFILNEDVDTRNVEIGDMDTDEFHSEDPVEDAASGEIDPNPIVEVEEAYRIMAESEANYNTIMQAIGIQELNHIAATGEEFIYEAADFKGFFTRVKQVFVLMGKKIATVVKNWISKVSSMLKTDKAFVEKYSTQIKDGAKKVKADNFKVKGYTFGATNNFKGIAAVWAAVQSKAGKAITVAGLDLSQEKMASESWSSSMKSGEDISDLMDTARGASIGSGDVSEADFAKEVFYYFRDGKKEKVDLKPSDYTAEEVISFLSGRKDIISKAKESYKSIEKEINGIIKDLNTAEHKLGSSLKDEGNARQHALSVITQAVNVDKRMLYILQTVHFGYLAAMRAQNTQARSIAARYIAAGNNSTYSEYKDKNKTKHESGFLSDVELF